MIISKITGGLGNQLFQYAIGRNMALKNKTDLRLDVSFYDTQEKRVYLLNNFNIAGDILNEKETGYIKKIQKRYSPSWFFNKINNKVLLLKENSDKYFQFDPSIIRTSAQKDIYLNGYWQNEKYFNDVRDVLLKEFVLKDDKNLEEKNVFKKINSTNSISIHFRRGDYLTEKKYHALPLSYYKEGLNKILRETGTENIHLFIFSDDIDWVKKEFKTEYPTIYIDNQDNLTDCEQLIAMSECKHNIIANSSFSWWSAWLNTNKDKKVICPSTWTEPEKNNIDDLFPNNWIKI